MQPLQATISSSLFMKESMINIRYTDLINKVGILTAKGNQMHECYQTLFPTPKGKKSWYLDCK